MPTDFYDVLGSPVDASSDELKRAYRSRVREYHPDVNDHPQGDAQFKLIRKANDVLSDPAERKDYDRMGHREYAQKRLDDLPPFSVFPEFEDDATNSHDDSDSESTSSGSSESDASTQNRATSNKSTRSQSSPGTSASARSTSERSTSAKSGGAATESTSHSTSASAANDDKEAASGTNRTNTDRSASTTAGAETESDSQWADLSGQAATQNTAQSAGSRRRRGLRRWYGVVFLALVAYLGGVGSYLLQYRGAARSLLADLTAAPVATLSGGFPIPSPTAYVVSTATAVTAGEPSVGLLFVGGTVLLPVAVLTAVAQFGRGNAWLYAVASLGPALTLAGFPFVVLPVAVLVVGLLALPLFSGLAFLFDVGRYLLATR